MRIIFLCLSLVFFGVNSHAHPLRLPYNVFAVDGNTAQQFFDALRVEVSYENDYRHDAKKVAFGVLTCITRVNNQNHIQYSCALNDGYVELLFVTDIPARDVYSRLRVLANRAGVDQVKKTPSGRLTCLKNNPPFPPYMCTFEVR
jgi:hypothetical protein